MTHQELLTILIQNNLKKEDFFKTFDYSFKTLSSNFKKDATVSSKLTKNLEIYLELNNIKQKNIKLQKEVESLKKPNNISFLSTDIINIAKHKSSSLGVPLEQYIASLIISNS